MRIKILAKLYFIKQYIEGSILFNFINPLSPKNLPYCLVRWIWKVEGLTRVCSIISKLLYIYVFGVVLPWSAEYIIQSAE